MKLRISSRCAHAYADRYSCPKCNGLPVLTAEQGVWMEAHERLCAEYSDALRALAHGRQPSRLRRLWWRLTNWIRDAA